PRRPHDRAHPGAARRLGYRRWLHPRRLPAQRRSVRGTRPHARGDRPRAPHRPLLPGAGRARRRAAARAGPPGGAYRRHSGDHQAPPRGLPQVDRAGRRVLPLERHTRGYPRRAPDRRRLRRGAGSPRDGRPTPMIERKSNAELETMARAGRVVADTLALLGEALRPGMTTQDLDEVAEGYIRAQGGVPTFKGYRGF